MLRIRGNIALRNSLLVLAIILAFASSYACANSSVVSGSTDNAETVSDKPAKVDSAVHAETCPRCGEEKADSARCKKCGLRLRAAPGGYIPYGLNSRTRYDLNKIGRSNQSINRSMRNLQKSLREMNTSIYMIRTHRRF